MLELFWITQCDVYQVTVSGVAKWAQVALCTHHVMMCSYLCCLPWWLYFISFQYTDTPWTGVRANNPNVSSLKLECSCCCECVHQAEYKDNKLHYGGVEAYLNSLHWYIGAIKEKKLHQTFRVCSASPYEYLQATCAEILREMLTVQLLSKDWP